MMLIPSLNLNANGLIAQLQTTIFQTMLISIEQPLDHSVHLDLATMELPMKQISVFIVVNAPLIPRSLIQPKLKLLQDVL
jgi:hypothetical protein